MTHEQLIDKCAADWYKPLKAKLQAEWLAAHPKEALKGAIPPAEILHEICRVSCTIEAFGNAYLALQTDILEDETPDPNKIIRLRTS